ncbi:MAG: DUF2306 domain-containing protein [Candidatus Pristimantibacillus sp.]
MNGRGARIKPWAFGIMAFLALLIGAYALLMYGSPDGIREQPFATEKGTLPELWYIVLWGHAVSSGVALAIGWLQFIKRIRHRTPNIHRIIGYVYSFMIVIGAVTGLYLAFYANGGWIARIGFASLSVIWLYTLFRSLKSIIVDHDSIQHGRWMTRNFALSCAAIMLRLYTTLAAIFLGLSDTNDTFFVIAWICWLPNLLVAEFLLGRTTPTKRKHQSQKPAL